MHTIDIWSVNVYKYVAQYIDIYIYAYIYVRRLKYSRFNATLPDPGSFLGARDLQVAHRGWAVKAKPNCTNRLLWGLHPAVHSEKKTPSLGL